MRRRPLARAAMVGGTAYVAGKHVQAGNEREAEEQARIAELEAQQAAPAAAPAPAGGGGMSQAQMDQLKQLADLHTQGVLTDAEFEVQKQKILQGM
ncbi:MAG TPA: SHOCT domain-containing protein [Gaiellaceae bacterium]|nr:SHOCT domain-containing protein [Gaiellaceae bacterium]